MALDEARLDDLLRFLLERRGSDLHLKVGSPPRVRVDGHLQPAPFDAPTATETERLAFALLPAARADEFEATSEADFALDRPGLGRFRVNVYRQRGTVGRYVRIAQVLPSGEDFLDKFYLIGPSGPLRKGRTITESLSLTGGRLYQDLLSEVPA